MAATVTGILLTGTHAARPTTGVSAGTLYSCTTHSLVYQTSDTGTTWATWGDLTAVGTNPNPTTIELGHASDTTLARVSAGVVSIEGTNIVKAGAATASGLTQATARILGRTTAATGAIEEITVGSGLSLSAGSLTSTGSSTPIASGTAFPGSPATNDLFFRTDYGLLFYYNGTRWLSLVKGEIRIVNTDGLEAFTAASTLRAVVPVWSGSDIWLESTQTWFFVGSGTALDASNKWVGTVSKTPAGTTLDTVTVNSGALNTHRQSTITNINALLGTTNFELEVGWVKTGTPSGIYTQTVISFRYVAV